jgi:hypothetical protein
MNRLVIDRYWITLEQASKRFNMPKSTIKLRIKQRLLTGKVLNRKLYVDCLDLYDMMRERHFILYGYLNTEREEKHGS